MKLGFTFLGNLDPKKFASEPNRQRACNMLGGMFLKQAEPFIEGEVKLLHSCDSGGALISLQCVFRDVQPEYLLKMNAYCEEVLKAINNLKQSAIEGQQSI